MVFSSVLFSREVCPPKPQVCSTWQVLSQVLCEMFSIDLKQWIYEKDCWVIAASIGLRGNSISRKYVASKDWTPWTNVSKMCRCSAITVTDLWQRCMSFCLFEGGHVTPTTHTHPSIQLMSSNFLWSFWIWMDFEDAKSRDFGRCSRHPSFSQSGTAMGCFGRLRPGSSHCCSFFGGWGMQSCTASLSIDEKHLAKEQNL